MFSHKIEKCTSLQLMQNELYWWKESYQEKHLVFIYGSTFSCYTEGNKWYWEIMATIFTQLINSGDLQNIVKNRENRMGKKKALFGLEVVWLLNKLLSHLPTYIYICVHLWKCSLSETQWKVSGGNTGHTDTPLTLMYQTCNEGLIRFQALAWQKQNTFRLLIEKLLTEAVTFMT